MSGRARGISPFARRLQQQMAESSPRCARCGKPTTGFQAAINPQLRSGVPRSMRDLDQIQTREQAGLCTCPPIEQDRDTGDEAA